MKNIFKLLISIMMVFQAVVTTAWAEPSGEFTMYASASTVEAGETFTVTFGNKCTGRVDVSVSNGTISGSSKLWLTAGDSPVSFTVTAGQSGTVTVTATPYDGVLSNPNAELFNQGPKTVSVKIKEKQDGSSSTPSRPSQTTPTDKEEEKVKINIKDAEVSLIPDYTYTGEEIRPTFDVIYDGKTLVEGTDYEVTYKNNIEVGVATIVLKGIGDYEGTKEVTFNITPIPEPEPSEIDCNYHWIIAIILLVAAFAMYVLKANAVIALIIGVVGVIVAFLLALVFGACRYDLPVAIIGAIALIVEYIIVSKK